MGKAELSTTSLSTCISTMEESLDSSMRRFWELESIPEIKSMTIDDEKCENHYKDNYRRDTDGRFIVPFKQNQPNLGNSYNVALKRFKLLENRLLKNVSLRDKYLEFMKDYLKSNHMSLVPSPCPSSNNYYIPHHCILRNEDPNSKLRVVFDASASSSNGKSLNDMLLIGPKLQQNIIHILINFRLFKYAFICDIKQMYRQIRVSPHDRSFQNILWRFSLDDPIQTYELNTVTYGVASAPFLALRTLIELSNIYSNEFPNASKVLQTNVYVDDIVTGAQSVEETLNLKQELISLLGNGGFQLRKWASNCPEVLREMSKADLQCPISLDYENTRCVKVLGLQWDPETDKFLYSYTPRDSSCTKRSILSAMARIYDPLGFLTPCTLKAKHIMQQLWQLQISWDDTPPDHIKKTWEEFKTKLSLLSRFNLSRFIIADNLVRCQLHLFCDASQIGYGTVAYIRTENESNQFLTYFICAKARVAPLKTLTIPRLELCGAVLLTQLFENIHEILSQSIHFESVTAWSDSRVVLSWLSSEPQTWKVFVANRVNTIQEILPRQHWRYVPSSDNPADCSSRGLNPEQLIDSELWWQGPSWLSDHFDNWPSQSSFNPKPPEIIGFADFINTQAQYYTTNNIIITMGDDFNYQDALSYFSNMDKLVQ
nr:uncharacterized protein LOC111416832 [Onthophagus taurus]